MSTVFSKIIAGGIAAVLIWLIYFVFTLLVSYIKTRKNNRMDSTIVGNNVSNKNIDTEIETNSKTEDKEIEMTRGCKVHYFNNTNIRAILFILIGCLSLYYSTQCVFYDQLNAFTSIYFGKGNGIANDLSSQINAVGFQARGDGKTIISLMQGLFIIIGLLCISYGFTSINFRKQIK